MLKLTIEGGSLQELKENVRELNDSLNGVEVENVIVDEPTVVTSTPAVQTTTSEELDSDGIPWNETIHANSKMQTKLGKWKRRKGVSDEVYNSVVAELKGKATSAPVVETPAPVVETPAPVVETPAPMPAPVVETPAPVAQGVDVNAPMSEAVFVGNFLTVIPALVTEGKLTQEYIGQLNAHYGVDEIWKITDEQKVQLYNFLIQHAKIVRG